MTFVFPVLLGGLVVAGVPILLHLIMRQKPKTLRFPAFRFLVMRHKTNLRRLRLRHLLLLVLRVLLITAICFALARPKLFNTDLNLSQDRPVAAIFLFDTSYSMGYKTSDGPSRLDEGRKRGLELLNELPDGSRVAILDTAEGVASRGEWLATTHQVRERIKGLQLRAANQPITVRLEDAFRMFADLARSRDDDPIKDMPQLLCVFSDRTHGCWDASRLPALHDALDQVPATVPGLQDLQDKIPALVDSLKELRQKLPPPAGKDYPEQALMDALQQLRERIPTIDVADLRHNRELNKLLNDVRRPARQIAALLQSPAEGEQPSEFREKLLTGLQTALGDLQGAHAIFIDVGVDKAVDLAIANLELPQTPDGQMQQLFSSDRKIPLRAVVQATGMDYRSTLYMQLDKKTWDPVAVTLKAGEKQTRQLEEIDCKELNLGPGEHQAEVRLGSADLLAFNNKRFVTFAIREPRKVLVLTDEPAKAKLLIRALWATDFAPEVKPASEAAKQLTVRDLGGYQAIYLMSVTRPETALWDLLADYVSKGGALGIIPGGKELVPQAYQSASAKKLMPGTLKGIVDAKDIEKGATWNFGEESIYRHPLLRPFRDWVEADFRISARKAERFWEVEPDKKSLVLVSYADREAHPALVERLLTRDKGRPGKVVLFTTTMDSPREPEWNNYLTNSFYVVVVGMTTQYLTGDTEQPMLNFLAGQVEPIVHLPASPRYATYTLRGPDLLEPIAVDEQESDVVIKQAVVPGNYKLEGATSDGAVGKQVAAFSVNLPPEESDLTRVPASEIDSLLGSGCVVPVERRTAIREALKGHWNQPVELFPFLMIFLLLVLAIENLLSNKFYRREPEENSP